MASTPHESRPQSPSLFGAIGLLLGYVAVQALFTPERKNEREEGRPFGEGDESESIAASRARVLQSGRGRRARAPWQIPWRGWKDILWRTYSQIQDDRLFAISAGVVFFALLALFPALTAIVSMYGLFADTPTIERHIGLIAGFAPEQAVSIVQEQIGRLVARGNTQLGFGFILGLGIAIWSANAGMKAIIDALNVVYGEKEKRGLIKLNLISLTLTVCAVAAVLFSIGAVVVVPFLLEQVGLGAATPWLQYGRWPILIAMLLLGLAILYRYGPSRNDAQWRWLSVGAVAAALLWIAGSAGFSFYIQNFANYDATYGSLGTGIGLMMWLWLSVIAILFGAELNAEIEHQTAMDSTAPPRKPLGERGAAMADSVGPAQS
jgi:membrane protein